MSSSGSQFTLLLWKNFKLQGRKKLVTVFEILIPILFALLLLMIRNLSKSKYIDVETTWSPISPQFRVANKTMIFYTPSNAFTDAIIQDMIDTGKTLITNSKSYCLFPISKPFVIDLSVTSILCIHFVLSIRYFRNIQIEKSLART